MAEGNSSVDELSRMDHVEVAHMTGFSDGALWMLALLLHPQVRAQVAIDMLPGILQMGDVASERFAHEFGGAPERWAEVGQAMLLADAEGRRAAVARARG